MTQLQHHESLVIHKCSPFTIYNGLPSASQIPHHTALVTTATKVEDPNATRCTATKVTMIEKGTEPRQGFKYTRLTRNKWAGNKVEREAGEHWTRQKSTTN